MAERIQKILSRAGYGSRREIERWVEQGEILVNGNKATTGQAIDENDKVMLRGQRLSLKSKLRAVPEVLIYHKRRGEICTRNDPEGRPTVFENLPKPQSGRWIQVGRLDINTDGLLLFTTDGELANRLMHPSREIEREYAVRVMGEVTQQMIKTLREGVELEDGMAKFLRIKHSGGEGINQWYHVVLTEGRNREVRRLWESQDLQVSRLTRVRFGSLTMPRWLRTGTCELLDVKSMRTLYESVELPIEDSLASPKSKKTSKPRPGQSSKKAPGRKPRRR